MKNLKNLFNNFTSNLNLLQSRDSSLFKNLPYNSNYKSWGYIKNDILHFKFNNNTYNINVKEDEKSQESKVFNLNISLNNKHIYTITDYVYGNYIYRVLNNHTLILKEGKLVSMKTNKKLKSLPKLNINNKKDYSIATIDIETYVDQGILVPYLIIFYYNDFPHIYYLSDYNSWEDMIKDCMNKVLKICKHNTIIYAHNFSNFDSRFIIPVLSIIKNIDLDLLQRDNNILNLKVKIDKKTIHFRDSYLIMTGSLKSLLKSYNIEILKGDFPHKFVNKNNLNYIGLTPSKDMYYNNPEDYQIINTWDLKKEAIKYCKNDCKGLHILLCKFFDHIYNTYEINVSKCFSLPSLAFTVFRKNFLKTSNIKL